MLNIGKLAGVDSVDYYLSQVASGVEDYYLGNGEAPGQWTGTAAPDLSLHGEVKAETLRRVLGGHDAAGKPLKGLRSSRKIPGFDLAFRAPTSVSLLWALGGHDVASDVHDAHDAAVAAALAYLEDHAGWTRRGAGGRHAVKGADSSPQHSATARHATAIRCCTRTCWSPTPSRPTTAAGERWTQPGCIGTPRPPATSTRPSSATS